MSPHGLIADLTHQLIKGSVQDGAGHLGSICYNHFVGRGVYTITCKANGGVYVGQSLDVEHRFLQHKSKLRRGSHSNPYLQAAWNKYGEEEFLFSIYEWENNPERCDELEQRAVDLHKQSGVRLFNIRPASASNRGIRLSEQTQRNIAKAIRNHLSTPEAREKHSMAI